MDPYPMAEFAHNSMKISTLGHSIWFRLGFAAFLGLSDPGRASGQPADSPASQPVAVATRPSLDDPWVVGAIRGTLPERTLAWSFGDTGAATPDMIREREKEFSDETIQALVAQGINTLLIPYGGFGPNSLEEIERLTIVDFAGRARRAGLRIGLWLPVGLLRPEDWIAAGQDITPWLATDAEGRPIASPQPGFIWASRLHPEYRAHADALLGEANRSVRPDFVVLPRFQSVGGYELWNEAHFGAWLRNRPSSAAPSAAANASRPAEPADAGAAALPPKRSTDAAVLSRWETYRTELLQLEWDRVRQLARDAGLTTAPMIETPMRWSGPGPGAAYDVHDLARRAGGVIDEFRVHSDLRGKVQHSIADLKAMNESGARVFAPLLATLDAAQALAFARDPALLPAWFHFGILTADAAGTVVPDRHVWDLVRFRARRREWFAGAGHVADVTLVRPAGHSASCSPQDAASYVQTESALVSHRVPFTVAAQQSEWPVRSGGVLLLAGLSQLDRQTRQRVQAHVAAGGALVTVGAIGTIDPDGRPTTPSLIAELTAGAIMSPPGAPGKGAVRYYQAGAARIVQMQRPGAPACQWLLAPRGKEQPIARQSPYDDDFTAALRWAAGGRLSIEGRLDAAAVPQLTWTADRTRAVLHIVNFDPRHAARPTELTLDLGTPTPIRRLLHVNPFDGVETSLPFERSPESLKFTTHECRMYDLYVIELRN